MFLLTILFFLIQYTQGQYKSEVWGVTATGDIYNLHWSSGTTSNNNNNWVKVPGNLKQIAVGSANNVWGIDANGQVYKRDFSNNVWTQIPSAGLDKIFVGEDDSVWGIKNKQMLKYANNAWVSLSWFTPAEYLTINNAGIVWMSRFVITSTGGGNFWTYTTQWNAGSYIFYMMDACYATGPNFWAIRHNNDLLQYNGAWKTVPRPSGRTIVDLSCAAYGQQFFLDANGKVWHGNGVYDSQSADNFLVDIASSKDNRFVGEAAHNFHNMIINNEQMIDEIEKMMKPPQQSVFLKTGIIEAIIGLVLLTCLCVSFIVWNKRRMKGVKTEFYKVSTETENEELM